MVLILTYERNIANVHLANTARVKLTLTITVLPGVCCFDREIIKILQWIII